MLVSSNPEGDGVENKMKPFKHAKGFIESTTSIRKASIEKGVITC
jgi:hypothetical protein